MCGHIGLSWADVGNKKVCELYPRTVKRGLPFEFWPPGDKRGFCGRRSGWQSARAGPDSPAGCRPSTGKSRYGRRDRAKNIHKAKCFDLPLSGCRISRCPLQIAGFQTYGRVQPTGARTGVRIHKPLPGGNILTYFRLLSMRLTIFGPPSASEKMRAVRIQTW